VVRSFAGSRIEQQIIAEAFRIAWHVAAARRRIGNLDEIQEGRETLAGIANAQREGTAS
jgi:hypothetical protein